MNEILEILALAAVLYLLALAASYYAIRWTAKRERTGVRNQQPWPEAPSPGVHLVRVCSWCKTHPPMVLPTADEIQLITHGICDECKKALKHDIPLTPKKHEQN